MSSVGDRRDAVDDLCQRYRYPAVVADQLHAILEVIEATVPRATLRAVVLFGSTARGEASIRATPQGFELFSDYELLVVTRGPIGDAAAECIARVDALARLWAMPNPFFHVDLGFNTLAQLYMKAPFRRNIANHEFWANGQVLAGAPLRRVPWLTGVTPAQLDLSAVNEIAIERLRQQLGHLVAEPAGSDAQRREWRTYAAARNTLDALTVLLPNRGLLLPGYRRRQEAFEREVAGRLDGKAELAAILASALEIKLSLDLSEPPDAVEARMLRAYLALGWYLARDAGAAFAMVADPLEVAAQLVRRGARAFREPILAKPARRRRERAVARALRLGAGWQHTEKRHVLFALLLLALHAALQERRGAGADERVLAEAVRLAEALTSARMAPAPRTDAVAHWTLALAGALRGKIAPPAAARRIRDLSSEGITT